MNNKAIAIFVAVVLLAGGAWLSWEGWGKKWGLKGISFRLGGIALLAGGAFAGSAALRK